MSKIQKCPHCGEFAPYRKQWETRDFVKIHCEKCGAWTRYYREGWENIMNDKAKLIFEILDIKPYEKFRIKYMNEEHLYKDTYRMTDDLIVQAVNPYDNWRKTDIDIREFFVGKYNIVKIQTPTENEQIAIDYAKACGCNWITKDSSGQIFGYHSKPKKCMSDDSYYQDVWQYGGESIKIGIPISFLSWGDEEPYYIGD